MATPLCVTEPPLKGRIRATAKWNELLEDVETGLMFVLMVRVNTLPSGRPRNSWVSPDQEVSGQKVRSREERLHLQGPLSLPLSFPVLLPLSHCGLSSKHMCVPHHDVQNKILKCNRRDSRKKSGRSVIFQVLWLISSFHLGVANLEHGVSDKVWSVSQFATMQTWLRSLCVWAIHTEGFCPLIG